MDLAAGFKQHLTLRLEQLEGILSKLAGSGLLIGAGKSHDYFQDDQEIPYRSNHHFRHYCPAVGKNHVLAFRPGKKPVLFYYYPQDFWYDHTPLGAPFWIDGFDVRLFHHAEDIWQLVKEFHGCAYLGPDEAEFAAQGFQPALQRLVHHLNWYRSYKSAYEVHCLDQATAKAALGHKAAKAAFLDGGSELDIYHAYLKASRTSGSDLPYTAIVCLNEKAAVLHYAEKRDDVRNGKVLLIDSGASFYGYGSDITRTYASAKAPEVFRGMVEDLDVAQKRLCQWVQTGVGFGDLQLQSHKEMGALLLKYGLVKGLSVDDMVERRITKAFYPHGVGHMLGIFVHDVGGKQKNPEGDPCDIPEGAASIRTHRQIEPGFLFTVEPGIYFIKMLLDPLREGEWRGNFDWPLIDALMGCGGIRIEDNVFVLANGEVRNLTRPYLP